MTARRDEIADALAHVENRIATACRAAGRERGTVTLVVVTKRFPASDIAHLRALGVTDIGENRDQELAPKLAKLAELGDRGGLTVHFVGQLQTNKAGRVAAHADVVHSVDRARLVDALAHGAERVGRRLGVLLQVALEEGASGRGGLAPDGVPALADLVAEAPGLDLRGVMAVAPLGADPAPAFARLVDVSTRLLADHPEASWISAGMSGDLEDAIAAGATHLRVGTAILGSRPSHG